MRQLILVVLILGINGFSYGMEKEQLPPINDKHDTYPREIFSREKCAVFLHRVYTQGAFLLKSNESYEAVLEEFNLTAPTDDWNMWW